jgi:hypothetical protein
LNERGRTKRDPSAQGGATDGYARLTSALDRFQEAHFWIHGMEDAYHFSSPFRWHLNAFLRALKEVPGLLQMALQNDSGFPGWFKERRAQLNHDKLIGLLSKNRDFIVHRSMLVPRSHGMVGITEGRGLKLGLTFPVHPLENSDDAMGRYLKHARKSGDFLGILTPDDDSVPCIYREWKLPEFDDELVDVCAKGWLRTGELVQDTLRRLGEKPSPLDLDCRHNSQDVKYRLFDRSSLRKRIGGRRRSLKGK